MRSIKFRAYDTQNELFVKPDDFYISSDGKVTVKDDYDDSVWHEGGPIELVEFTGLLDKESLSNIYEYDIIDEDGKLIGNFYENRELIDEEGNIKNTSHIIIQGFGTEDWETTNTKALERGCCYAK